MKTYKIWYSSSDGDTTKVWTTSETKEEAIEKIKREYWDCKEIVDIIEDND